MVLQERKKKIQEFEDKLEAKKVEATKKRSRQIDDINKYKNPYFLSYFWQKVGIGQRIK